MGKPGPVRRHEIVGLHGTQGDDVLVGSEVAHDPDRVDWQEHRERLGGAIVQSVSAQLADENVIGVLEDRDPIGGHLAENADGLIEAHITAIKLHFHNRPRGHA